MLSRTKWDQISQVIFWKAPFSLELVRWIKLHWSAVDEKLHSPAVLMIFFVLIFLCRPPWMILLATIKKMHGEAGSKSTLMICTMCMSYWAISPFNLIFLRLQSLLGVTLPPSAHHYTFFFFFFRGYFFKLFFYMYSNKILAKLFVWSFLSVLNI